MKLIQTVLGAACILVATSATALAQAPLNDDCPSPVITGTGIFPFDLNSANATDSVVGQPACALRPSNLNDVFFTWTCPADGDYEFTTESEQTIGYDTVMVLYDGDACDGSGCIDYDDDDGPGFGSYINTLDALVTGPLTAGDTYVIQVGAWSSTTTPTGTNLLTIDLIPTNCAETTFVSNNGGSIGGAAYFDVTGTADLVFEGVETHFGADSGTTVGMQVWTIANSTYAGNETTGAWVQVGVDDGTGVAAGVGFPTPITFETPVTLPAGTNAVALVAINSDHLYTNGDGANESAVSFDGAVTLSLGSTSNVAFMDPVFSPRVWNGILCEALPSSSVGTPFCDPMNVNSTGLSTTLTGTLGSGVGSGLNLQASNGPVGLLGYILVGMGFSDPGIAISDGYFCLAPGPAALFGRYNVSGTDANSVGFFDEDGILQNAVGTATSSGGAGFDVPSALPNIGGVIMAGNTLHFQLWHRDILSATNFSNGLSVTF
ncbi:MAG: hypothetical protein GY930_02420 [bacterium]|nr:hypothetical protein [bacterium]